MATDYSLVVTWTYFSVYVLTFFIVSIICALKITKEYKHNKSSGLQLKKKDLFIQWIKLLWRKKKIYFHLIPHFFDQATDFGVIIEYYRLSNDGEDHGIDTWYLFGVSIAVIIIHRIATCTAVYKLTKNWKYMLYQLFDLLMIQCIWTNYQLDTDEPTNAQRYLQVLEATFEVKLFAIN